MLKLKILVALSGALVLAGMAPLTASDASLFGSASATIQATARVAPSIGLAEAGMIDVTPTDDVTELVPGSHLFWLYYPKVDGIQIRVQCGDESLIDCGLKNADPVESGVLVLTEYGYASLVDFGDFGRSRSEVSEPLTVTLVYTDN